MKIKGSRTLILGAGISGLTAAISLAERGGEVHLHESQPRAGGLLRPVSLGGLRCDLGSHRVHPEAAPALSSLGVDWVTRARRGVLVLGGQHIEYPPSLPGFLRGLGLRKSLQFAGDFLTQRASLSKFLAWESERGALSSDVGFASFVRTRAGEAAYRAFYQPYAEKVFGVDADALSQSVAKKRLSTTNPLRSLLRGAKSKTFLYPSGGMSSLLDGLVSRAESLGVTASYRGLPPERAAFDRVLFSGYPGSLVDTKLSYKGLYLLYLVFPVDTLGQVDTYYLPEKKFWFGRVSVPQNFSSVHKASGESVLCVEIPEAQFGTQEDFTSRLDTILGQLSDAKIVSPGLRPTQCKQVFLPKVYPLYTRGWLSEWRAAMRSLCALGVFPFGRQGLFLHCNIDHCVQITRDLVSYLEQEKTPDEWVNFATRYLDVRVRD